MLVSGGWFRAAGFGRLVSDQPEQNPYSAPDPAQYGYSQYGQTPTQQPQNPYAQPGPPAQAQYPQAQYPQRQYPQAHHAQGQYDPWGQSIQAGWTPSPPPAASGGVRKKAILAGAVAVVVVTGGAVSYVAFQDKNNGGGAGSPKAAVATIVTSLSKSDLLGVLDDLPPAERASIHDSFVSQVSQLKRLKVLNSSADANKVSGVTFAAKGLTYGASVAVNDHVQLVTITGGTISINADAGKVPYTKAFVDAAFNGKAPTESHNQTIDIAKEAATSGEPLRIAVQKVAGKWYPSLMYTVVAAAASSDHLGIPTAADAIAPVGAGSADDAVRQMVTAATRQDFTSLIAGLDPNEDAALHDYGTLLIKNAPRPTNGSLDLRHITFTDTSVAGGTLVSLHERPVQLRRPGRDVDHRRSVRGGRSRVGRPRRCARCRPWTSTAPTCTSPRPSAPPWATCSRPSPRSAASAPSPPASGTSARSGRIPIWIFRSWAA